MKVFKEKPIMILHGLGDNFLLFPVLYDYYLQHGKKKLVLAVAKEYGAKNFWDNISFVKRTYEITLSRHPQYWNILSFFMYDYFPLLHTAQKITGEKNIIFLRITHFPLFLETILSQFSDRRKTILAYKELHTKPLHLANTLTLEKFLKKNNPKNPLSFLRKNGLKKNGYVILHRKTFAQVRSLKKSQIEGLLKEHSKTKFVIIMNSAMKKDEQKQEGGNLRQKNAIYTANVLEDFTDLYFLLAFAKCSVVIDSSIMHLSRFTKTPTLALFKVKKVNPSIYFPFAKHIFPERVFSEKAEDEAIRKFLTKQLE